ncbi:hypothetical protein [Actinocatenispora comari]|jgi:hypothetical protein|uniref:FtsX extracellular domain-containing protein n=1 Tax=Actinocatenispora comari TaxID=2807577 RepID=A0A8J4A9F6_9ACTN|nr:hypothetical protein [Actinocatenispora comari]GIL27314.1 hypothetical protein NUM_25680 [Actinocatenispora comari]
MSAPQQPVAGAPVPGCPPPTPTRRGTNTRLVVLLAVGGGVLAAGVVLAVVLAGLHLVDAKHATASAGAGDPGPMLAVWQTADATPAEHRRIQQTAQRSRQVQSVEFVTADAATRPGTAVPERLRPPAGTDFFELRLRSRAAIDELRGVFATLPGVRAVRSTP